MKNMHFDKLSFPTRSDAVFDKMLWTDWYDGLTAGLVVSSQTGKVFKLDILAWDAGQKRRIFVLSPFDFYKFDRIVALLAENAVPTWPKWDPEWPPATPDREHLRAKLEHNLRSEGSPEYVLSSEASFEYIYGLRRIEESDRELLPQEFHGLPFRDNFDYWQQRLESSSSSRVP